MWWHHAGPTLIGSLSLDFFGQWEESEPAGGELSLLEEVHKEAASTHIQWTGRDKGQALPQGILELGHSCFSMHSVGTPLSWGS